MTGWYYEQWHAGKDRWSPVTSRAKPVLNGDRIKRISGQGPRIRCLQPLRLGYGEGDLDWLAGHYGPDSPTGMALAANRAEGKVELDVEVARP